MARRQIEVRSVVVDGEQRLLLEPGDYEVLEASRRQLGAYRSQLERLKGDLGRSRERLESLREPLRRAEESLVRDPCRCGATGSCSRCRALESLRGALDTIGVDERA